MLNVTTSPEFNNNFDPEHPLSKIPGAVAEACARTLAVEVDIFVRQAIKKAIPDNLLALYADDGKKFPGLDLNIMLLAPNKRKISVIFRGHELGHATFETRMVRQDELIGMQLKTAILAKGGDNPVHAIIHEKSDVWLHD